MILTGTVINDSIQIFVLSVLIALYAYQNSMAGV